MAAREREIAGSDRAGALSTVGVAAVIATGTGGRLPRLPGSCINQKS